MLIIWTISWSHYSVFSVIKQCINFFHWRPWRLSILIEPSLAAILSETSTDSSPSWNLIAGDEKIRGWTRALDSVLFQFEFTVFADGGSSDHEEMNREKKPPRCTLQQNVEGSTALADSKLTVLPSGPALYHDVQYGPKKSEHRFYFESHLATLRETMFHFWS